MIAALIQVITGIGESRPLSGRDPKASSVKRLTWARAAPRRAGQAPRPWSTRRAQSRRI